MLYLLDTNILLAYIRRGDLYRKIDARYGLDAAPTAPLISVVTRAEIRALAEENNWGGAKRSDMTRLLGAFTELPIPFADVVDRYVELSELSRRAGRVVGKNDLWIAASASSLGATLLTTDRDFDVFPPALLAHEWVNPAL